MKESPRHGVEPLSSTEFAELEAFLARCGGSEPMSLEALDGFFCALVVGPETILPREYLPVLAGGSRTAAAHVFESVEEAGSELSGPIVVGRILAYANEPQSNGKTIRWVQVDVGELRDHEEEQVRSVELRDVHVEVELVDHVPGG